jgi:Flp pilus assembly pilin Flp
MWPGKMNKMVSRHGQSIVEYAMIAALVSVACVAMSTYVFRAVQATQQMIQAESRQE